MGCPQPVDQLFTRREMGTFASDSFSMPSFSDSITTKQRNLMHRKKENRRIRTFIKRETKQKGLHLHFPCTSVIYFSKKASCFLFCFFFSFGLFFWFILIPFLRNFSFVFLGVVRSCSTISLAVHFCLRILFVMVGCILMDAWKSKQRRFLEMLLLLNGFYRKC